MADMERMIPHILMWEVGVRDSEKGLSPREMYGRVSKRGFHVVANDKGGPTMCGVTLSTFRDWRKRMGSGAPAGNSGSPTVEDLKRLGYDEWLAILKSLFWDPCKGDIIANQSIAQMLVDWRWVNGTQAVRDAQAVLSCVADGIVGPKTLAALNNADSASVFTRLKNARIRSYDRIVARSPGQKVFYRGWINRVNSISYAP